MPTTPQSATGDRRPRLSVDASHVAPSSLSSRAALAVATGGLVSLASAGTALLVMTSTSAVAPASDADTQPLLGGRPGSSEVVVPQAPSSQDAALLVPTRTALPGVLVGTSGDRPVRVRLPGPLESAPGARGPVVPDFPPLSGPVDGPAGAPVGGPVEAPGVPVEVPGVAVPPALPEAPGLPAGGDGPVTTPRVPPVLDGPADAEGAPDSRPVGKPEKKDQKKAERKADSRADQQRDDKAVGSRDAAVSERTGKVRAALRAEAARIDRERREDRFRDALRRELAAPTRSGRVPGHADPRLAGHGRLAV